MLIHLELLALNGHWLVLTAAGSIKALLGELRILGRHHVDKVRLLLVESFLRLSIELLLQHRLLYHLLLRRFSVSFTLVSSCLFSCLLTRRNLLGLHLCSSIKVGRHELWRRLAKVLENNRLSILNLHRHEALRRGHLRLLIPLLLGLLALLLRTIDGKQNCILMSQLGSHF